MSFMKSCGLLAFLTLMLASGHCAESKRGDGSLRLDTHNEAKEAKMIYKLLSYEGFVEAREGFFRENGNIPYVTGGAVIFDKGGGVSMANRDAAFLVADLLKRKQINLVNLFEGLSSDSLVVRCAAGSAFESAFPQKDTLYRYAEDPTSEDNKAAIEYWGKCLWHAPQKDEK